MKSVMDHSFSRAPNLEAQRSSFNRSNGVKTTIDADKLIPIENWHVISGDTINLRCSVFGRMNTPLYPLMDNLWADIHFFFVPYRQLWSNWRAFMGETTEKYDPQDPPDHTDHTIPQVTGLVEQGSLSDYFGYPIDQTVSVSAFNHRAYWHIFNEWYRDQSLIDPQEWTKSDSSTNLNAGSGTAYYEFDNLAKRAKGHDYFTSCLPFLQKGDPVSLPLGTAAPIVGLDQDITFNTQGGTTYGTASGIGNGGAGGATSPTTIKLTEGANSGSNSDLRWDQTALEVDLSNATSATINELRQAMKIQHLMEINARSGSRYPELIKAHFGVDFQDVTYRPEYLGGSKGYVTMSEVPHTTNGEDADGNAKAAGELSAAGAFKIDGAGFTKSFTEHGVVMAMLSVKSDLTYQQGIEREALRETRFDYYFPSLAHLGEQAVLNKEIYYKDSMPDTNATGTGKEDVFGYQERWAEMRYKNSKITGKMRSDATGSLDVWHLSQDFNQCPKLNKDFIESAMPIDRIVAFPDEPDFHVDSYFKCIHTRPMPVYSIPSVMERL